jgi:hypothetical protein
MQKIWLVAKRKEHRLPPALLFLYEPLALIIKDHFTNDSRKSILEKGID